MHITEPFETDGTITSQGQLLRVKTWGWYCCCGKKDTGYPNKRNALLGAQLHRGAAPLFA